MTAAFRPGCAPEAGKTLAICGQHVYNVAMRNLRRTNVYLQPEDLEELEEIGKRKGGLKLAQMIRLAISEYIARERGTEREESK